VLPVGDACAEADVIMILLPDTVQAQVYRESIQPHLAPGKTLMFAHGFNIRYGQITPPPTVDVSMVARSRPDTGCASCLSRGRGRHACWRCSRMPAARPRRSRWPMRGGSAARVRA